MMILQYDIARSKTACRIDNKIVSQYNTQVNYWNVVFKRILAVIKFSASRGLSFCGNSETLGQKDKENYL